MLPIPHLTTGSRGMCWVRFISVSFCQPKIWHAACAQYKFS